MVILAAIGEHERSKTVAKIATDLALTYGDTLIALHVMPDTDFESHKNSMKNISGMEDYSFTQAQKSAEKFARDLVLESTDNVDSQQIEARGRIGKPSEIILSEAASLEPRFLVIGGRRRSPSGKALFGSTTQQVLLNADCPVVTRVGE